MISPPNRNSDHRTYLSTREEVSALRNCNPSHCWRYVFVATRRSSKFAMNLANWLAHQSILISTFKYRNWKYGPSSSSNTRILETICGNITVPPYSVRRNAGVVVLKCIVLVNCYKKSSLKLRSTWRAFTLTNLHMDISHT